MDRRQVLQLGAAGAAVLAVSTRSAAASLIAPDALHQPIYKLIHDDRYESGRVFGRAAAELGAPSVAIQGDITDVWYNDLALRWRQGPAAIAGLTSFAALFCLERLAWDAGMRVVFKAEHRRLAGGGIEHRLTGASGYLARWSALERAGADWRATAPRLLLECPEGRCAKSELTVTSRPLATEAGEPEQLTSWVIAPVQRA